LFPVASLRKDLPVVDVSIAVIGSDFLDLEHYSKFAGRGNRKN
jgi:hypothetical protein